MDYQNIVLMIKIKKTLLETSFKTGKFLVDYFMQENKLAAK